jgi:hypothetical protein
MFGKISKSNYLKYKTSQGLPWMIEIDLHLLPIVDIMLLIYSIPRAIPKRGQKQPKENLGKIYESDIL